MNREFNDRIQSNPVVAAIKDVEKIDTVIKTDVAIIFLLSGEILTLGKVVEKIKKAKKLVYVHVDLINGLSRDKFALDYIKEKVPVDGIITTKSSMAKLAKEMGFFVIQRFFIFDSMSLKKAIKIIETSKPNAIEILPGIVPKVVEKLSKKIKVPIITGGLIDKKEEIFKSLNAGADGISTTDEKMWEM